MVSVCPSVITSTFPLYDVLDHTNHIFSEGSWPKDILTDIPKCFIQKYTNTNTQIHKYTNIVYDEVPERPNMWYIFGKRIVLGYQKWYSHVSNSQIHKYKYTNTQIQHMTKCQKYPTCGGPSSPRGLFILLCLYSGIKSKKTTFTKLCKIGDMLKIR